MSVGPILSFDPGIDVRVWVLDRHAQPSHTQEKSMSPAFVNEHEELHRHHYHRTEEHNPGSSSKGAPN